MFIFLYQVNAMRYEIGVTEFIIPEDKLMKQYENVYLKIINLQIQFILLGLSKH